MVQKEHKNGRDRKLTFSPVKWQKIDFSTSLFAHLFTFTPSGAKPEEVSPEWTFNVNMQLIKQADRYVASNNKQFLEALVQSYKLHPEYHDDALVAKIFGEV